MAKLNDTSKQQLKHRMSNIYLRKPTVFSIIFLADEHVGMNERPDVICKYEIKSYKAILKSINSRDNALMAIFSGGDEGDRGRHLGQFVAITNNFMNNKSHRIPYFAGIGNHEYKEDPSLSQYKKYVSLKLNDVIMLYDSSFGPKVAVIMLNTGGPANDGCLNGKGAILKNSILEIKNSAAYKTVIKDKDVKIIIDMHMPPRMNKFKGNPPSHVLCPNAEALFKNFVNDIGENRILFIVTHHNHIFIQNKVDSKYFYLNKIPVFLTAQGGNCDPVFSSDKRSRYSYYKIEMFTNTPDIRENYKLKNVYRFDIDVDTSKVVKRITIY